MWTTTRSLDREMKKSQKNVISGIEQLQEEQTKNSAVIQKQLAEINDKLAQIELANQSGQEKLSSEIQAMKGTMKEMTSLITSQESVFSENMSTMNLAMQEVMKNLLNLDEGNRLIIAKMLLKDLGD